MKTQGQFQCSRLIIIISILFLVSLLYGCKGSAGDAGSTTGTVSGTVTSATGGAALAGVLVTASPGAVNAVSASDGTFSIGLQGGAYTLSFALTYYTSATINTNVAANTTTTVNVTMAEASSGKPSVSISAAGQNVGYGASVNITASATDPNSDTLTYIWSGATGSGTAATATMPTLTTALAGTAAPSNDPGGYITAYTQENRFGILPISSDTRGAKTISVKADDGRGQSTTASVTVYATGFQPGVRSVAVGVPIYFNSGHDGTNNWSLTPDTSIGSAATLTDSDKRNPYFTPDKSGKYTLTEKGAGSTVINTIDVFAGKWVGALQSGSPNEDANGNPYATPDSTCTACHDGTTAPDQFTPWKNTKHAVFFAKGINNVTSNSGSCITCHTVGYDTASSAANDGFDDLMTATGWTYPSVRKAGNWNSMWAIAPSVAKRANIQCESCHGPNSEIPAHKSTASVPANATIASRISYATEVCAPCHASGTGHHIVSEWMTLNPDSGFGHSNIQRSEDSGTNTSCARCHSAQGYSVYLSQISVGNIGSIPGSKVLWTKANVQPVTCTACHDPHDATNEFQLRLVDNTPLLPAGFKVVGVGKGALCMSCHNSRNAAQCNDALTPTTTCGSGKSSTTLTYLHEDGETYNSGNPTSYSAPHTACQTDVFMGRNAYFMVSGNLPQISRHAAIEDTCVGCHMKLNPQTHLSHGAPEVSKHVFYIKDADKATVCANCHSSNVNGEALVAWVEEELEVLKLKMENAAKTKVAGTIINAVTYELDATTDRSSNGFDLDLSGNPITKLELFEVHGQIGFLVTLTNAINISYKANSSTGAPAATISTNTFEIQLGSLKTAGGAAPVYALNGNFVRAGWNFFLVEGDKSKGIHNPGFVKDVLNITISKDISN